MLLMSQGLGAITGVGAAAFENYLNSPKRQIHRLKKAGIHPNAFYELGNTGGVGSVDPNTGDPAGQFQQFTQGLIDMDIHESMMGSATQLPQMTGNKFQDVSNMALWKAKSTNLYRAGKLAEIGQQQAGALKARTDARATADKLPFEIENIAQDTQTSAALEANYESGTNVNKEKILNMAEERLTMQKQREKYAQEILMIAKNMEGVDSQISLNEAKEAYQQLLSTYQDLMNTYQPQLWSAQVDQQDQIVLNLMRELDAKLVEMLRTEYLNQLDTFKANTLAGLQEATSEMYGAKTRGIEAEIANIKADKQFQKMIEEWDPTAKDAYLIFDRIMDYVLRWRGQLEVHTPEKPPTDGSYRDPRKWGYGPGPKY